MAAHELRRPLAPIRSAAAMLGRLGADDTAGAGQAASDHRASGSRTWRVSSTTCSIFRDRAPESSDSTARSSIFGDVIGAAIEAGRPAAERRRQRLVVVVLAARSRSKAIPLRLAQVVGNLLDNASRFTPDAGSIELLAAAHGDLVILSVADSGIGIEQAALAHVFERSRRTCLVRASTIRVSGSAWPS